MRIFPTVGRIVYYRDWDKRQYAAIVTYVHGDNTIDLTVFMPGWQSYQHHVFMSDDDIPNTWDWMPFQKDQQARLKD